MQPFPCRYTPLLTPNETYQHSLLQVRLHLLTSDLFYVQDLMLTYCVSEWVEFTPYEIGMDKYGTFMRTELFGSKFFCGKLIEKFPESPLYYLQGKLI